MILDKGAAQAGTADILTQHCIPTDRSADLRGEGGAGTPAAAAAAAKPEPNGAAKQDGVQEEEEEAAAAGMDVDVAARAGEGLPGSGAAPAR